MREVQEKFDKLGKDAREAAKDATGAVVKRAQRAHRDRARALHRRPRTAHPIARRRPT